MLGTVIKHMKADGLSKVKQFPPFVSTLTVEKGFGI